MIHNSLQRVLNIPCTFTKRNTTINLLLKRLKCKRCNTYVPPKCNCRTRERLHDELLKKNLLGTTRRLEDPEVWQWSDQSSKLHDFFYASEEFQENKQYSDEWIHRKHKYVKHYNCDCLKRERRDNQLAREGKLRITQRLEEESEEDNLTSINANIQ